MYSIQVINIHKVQGDFIYIGRGSVFGNPFIIGKDGSREEVIEKFRSHLYTSILNLSPLGRAVLQLASCSYLVLGCHCAPLACHGDVIASCIRWLRTKA